MRSILTYHSIDDSGSAISISPDAFSRHVEYLTSGAIDVGTVDEVQSASGDRAMVALTFDDGFCNFAECAWPLLRDAGLPVTVFVVTDHVGGDNSWGGSDVPDIPRLPLLDWDSLAVLAEEGVSIQCHSRRHTRLDRVTEGALLEDELAGAAREMERRLGIRPFGFCYPYGAWNRDLAIRCAEHFRWACTTDLALLASEGEPMALPRLDAFYLRGPNRLESYGSGRFDRYIRWRALLRRLRAAVGRPLDR